MVSRNTIIAGVFNNLGIMDKRGTGMLRMNKFCDEWALPHPEPKEESGYFGIVFRNPDYYTKAVEIDTTGLNERQKKAKSIEGFSGTGYWNAHAGSECWNSM